MPEGEVCKVRFGDREKTVSRQFLGIVAGVILKDLGKRWWRHGKVRDYKMLEGGKGIVRHWDGHRWPRIQDHAPETAE